MKFAALGRTHWLRDAIRAAASRGHQPVLIGSAPPSPEYLCDENDFRKLALEFGCAYLTGDINSAAAIEMMRHSGADVAISINWPKLMGAAAREIFPHGVINAHAGDLPRYRGNACPNWAILNGESRVVVTLHVMADELDAGPILLQRPCPILEDTYIADVYAFMTATIPEMYVEVLDGLASGSITPRPQRGEPLRCYPRRPEDGAINWTLPAVQLSRLVRASAEPFAGAFTVRNGARLTIWRARATAPPSAVLGVPGQVTAIDVSAGTIDVLTGDGILTVAEVQLEDGPRERAAGVIRSTRERLGRSRTEL